MGVVWRGYAIIWSASSVEQMAQMDQSETLFSVTRSLKKFADQKKFGIALNPPIKQHGWQEEMAEEFSFSILLHTLQNAQALVMAEGAH